MRETNYLQIVTSGLHRTAGPYRSSHPACTARPVHTKVHGQAMWTAVPGMAHLPA